MQSHLTRRAVRTLVFSAICVCYGTTALAQASKSSDQGLTRTLLKRSTLLTLLPNSIGRTALIFTQAVPRLVTEQAFQFAVAGVTPDGDQVQFPDVKWKSSNPDVATVSPTGLVVGMREGRSFIIAAAGRQEVRVRVTVLPPQQPAAPIVMSLEVTPSTAMLEAGTTLQFASSARTSDGAVVPDATVSYASSDTTVARISSDGLLSARNAGTVEVKATSGSTSRNIAVQVSKARVTGITINPKPIAITTTDTVALTVIATRRDGSAAPLSELRPSAKRGSFRGFAYVPPTTAGADTITVTALDGFSVIATAVVTAPQAPVLPTPPVDGALGALPQFAVPARPTAQVNTAPVVESRVIRVPANDAAALQAALNAAVGGDAIVLPNGSEYVGNFVLPAHSGSGSVTLRSETLPTAGVRVTPATSTSLARIVTANSMGALSTGAGAAYWRARGVCRFCFDPTSGR